MSDNPELRRALREAHREEREIVVDRVRWLVYELPPPDFDRRSSPSLVFESEGTVRRVRNFSADWRTLSDEALFALSWTV
ncbi:MAG TPA: hypothetical protein VJN70_21325 [Gemmatimonadaceae bacterium]|nr:hypothetical protein [Gemmatimonadaceae bacterium]